jgi:type III secretion system YscJ/HrcJ family lipoprotein
MIGLVLIILITGSCRETLHENLSEDEANEIVRRLRQYGIEAEKDQSSVFGKESQWTVAVPDADFKASLEILDALHLPRPRIQSHEAIMKQGSLIPTAKEEERLELYSRQEELREALLKMNGIYDAIVLITGPEKGPFQQKSAEPSSASVMIFCSAEGAIHLKIPEIQEFIASAWPNLAKERVTVLLHVEGGKKGDSISPQGGDFAVIGPIEVSKGTKPYFIGLILFLCASIILLAAFLVISILRYRKKMKKRGEPNEIVTGTMKKVDSQEASETQ